MTELEAGLGLSWEEWVEQATEDASAYLRGLEAWPNPPEGDNHVYLLTSILTHRAKSRLALDRVPSDLPSTSHHHKERLDLLWLQAERLLNAQIISSDKKVEQIIGQELTLYVDRLNHTLMEVRRMAQDADMMDDRELFVTEDLRRTSHDFLLSFQKMALVSGELRQRPFDGKIDALPFQEKFDDINQLFRKYFGYFYDIRDRFPLVRKREYGFNGWWLANPPEFEDVQEDDIPEEVMAAFAEAFQDEYVDESEDWSFSEKTIAYALDELGTEEAGEIRRHLLRCHACKELFDDVRHAEIEVQKQKDQQSPVVQPAILDVLQVFIRKISSVISQCLTPKIITAMATACLILATLTLYRSYQTPFKWPVSVTITLIGNPIALSSTRTKGVTTSIPGEFEVKVGGVLKTGDFFKIKVETDKDAYVYVVFYDSSEQISAPLIDDQLTAGRLHLISDGNYGFELDENTGVEIIYALASKEVIEDFDKRVEELKERGIGEISRVFPEASVQSFSFRHE